MVSTPLFWGVDLPLPGPDAYRRPRLESRRRHPRHGCELSVEIRVQNSTAPIWSTTDDVSETGCFVHMLNVLPVSARLDIAFWAGETKIWAQGVVSHSLSGAGAGIQLVAMSEDARARLREFIANTPHLEDRRVTSDEDLAWEAETEAPSEQIPWNVQNNDAGILVR
jgi:hypothetical protein